ncbi:Poly(A) polymerase central domain-containing protein, partial [Dichotomocladium elegans]
MSYETRRQWGVTPPVSTALPTDNDLRLSRDLVRTLHEYGLFETEQMAKMRCIVLERLDGIVKEFVCRVGMLKGMSESIAKETGGKIVTFGSYRLGVNSPDADIDTLCLVPYHVEREHFFTVLYDMLKSRPEVTELTAVSEAFVPVIKLQFSGIAIDLVCSRLMLPQIPDNLDLSDNNLLRDLDDRCVRGLNGSRVTDEILRLVPNIPVFRTSLRTIKLWATRRAIYSNVMGFLGGVAWAMLVAKICQLYPNACEAVIVNQFFRIMNLWNWPEPVILKEMEESPLQLRVWNPKIYPADRFHRMPVITPVYPSMCATHNVTDSTRAIMVKEFKRGADTTDRILMNSGKWHDLFESTDFFHAYKHYLQVIASSDSAEKQLTWSRMVEAKLRQLVLKLELVDMLVLAHPYIKRFDKVHYCRDDKEREDAAKGIFVPEITFPLGTDTQANPSDDYIMYTTTFYIGLYVEPKTDRTAGPRKVNLVWQVHEFINTVKSWENFDSQHMDITIKNMKRCV